MADDQGKGAGKSALAEDVLAARAAEQRERDAVAFAEREYDLARQSAATADGDGHRLGRVFGRGYYGPHIEGPNLPFIIDTIFVRSYHEEGRGHPLSP